MTEAEGEGEVHKAITASGETSILERKGTKEKTTSETGKQREKSIHGPDDPKCLRKTKIRER
jgi:hypothetical protein